MTKIYIIFKLQVSDIQRNKAKLTADGLGGILTASQGPYRAQEACQMASEPRPNEDTRSHRDPG